MVAPLALAVGAGLLIPFGVAFWDVPRSALGLVAASAALELAAECLELYLWDRLGSDN